MVHTTVDPIITSILVTTGEAAVASAIATEDTAAKPMMDWLFKDCLPDIFRYQWMTTNVRQM